MENREIFIKEIIIGKNKLRWLWVLLTVAVMCLIGVLFYQPFWASDTLFFCSMYIIVVVAGILAIAFLSSPVSSGKFLFFALSVSTLFIFLNAALLKIIFVISFWKACLIGVIAGLINEFMVFSATTIYR